MIQEKMVGTKTLEQLLAECKPTGAGDAGKTAGELAESLGISVKTMRTKLGQAIRSGAVVVGHARRSRIDGLSTIVPVYRLKEQTRRRR